jgi:hypothetical protein
MLLLLQSEGKRVRRVEGRSALCVVSCAGKGEEGRRTPTPALHHYFLM